MRFKSDPIAGNRAAGVRNAAGCLCAGTFRAGLCHLSCDRHERRIDRHLLICRNRHCRGCQIDSCRRLHSNSSLRELDILRWRVVQNAVDINRV